MTIKEFFSFRQNKYFWVNILAMIAAVSATLFVVLKGVDVYTRHGQAVVVPDVKGMGTAEAEKIFRNHGLNCVVSDSGYVKTMPAGCILEYTPSAGQKVKEGRTVYLTVNALNTPLLTVPDVADNSSVRQAEARLLAVGFKLDEIEYVAGEKDWVYGVKYKGRQLELREQVPVGVPLTLMVGNGEALPQETDSLWTDSVGGAARPAAPGKSEADEPWF